MTSRRDFFVASSGIATLAASSSVLNQPAAAALPTPKSPAGVRFCLNTSTIRGQKLSITQQVDVAAKAGYDGIEPWMRDIQAYVDGGGSLADLRKRIEDAGLTVESAIGFANWIVDDDAKRAAGLETARHDMGQVAAIGGTRIAAPPIGAHKNAGPDLPTIARRYRALLDVGTETGVVPMLELWGFSASISKLAELAYIATGAEHPDACVLPDFYHIYKGGNDFSGLRMIEASRIPVFHINDYPADPPIDKISDKDRVFPGDGVCELPEIIRGLVDVGFSGALSLELFNPDYWERDALGVAREGLEKSKAVYQLAMQN